MAERISTPSKTKEIIEANRFAFKKNFGQNFLIDSNILDNIAACAGVTKEDCVLEIGPGIGSLTQVLAENAGQVVAVEIDNTLIPILKQTLADYDNIEILNQDILKTDIDAIIREKNDGRPIKVVANLPYYITTPIIMDLLENERHVDSITVMVQKEVAERMQARPKEKEYGALSIAVQYYCDAKLDMIVQPACFMPRPKVASAVITLKVLPERKVKTADEKLFFHLVKCAFGQRRKTLMNCLFHLGNLGFSKEELAELLEELGWDTRVRGEALALEEFAALTDKIEQKKASIYSKTRKPHLKQMRFFHKLTSFSQIFVRIISLFLPIITNSVCILRRHTAGFLRGFEKNRKILVFLVISGFFCPTNGSCRGKFSIL